MSQNSERARLVVNETVKAVHDDDLSSLLRSLDMFDAVLNGEKQCIYCSAPITLDNIDALIPRNGKVEFSCTNPKCHFKMIGIGDNYE